METKVSEILENILGFLSLEGSFDIEEKTDGVFVSIDTNDAGRLIGRRGETLSSLQLIVNLILSRSLGEKEQDSFKKVVVDVSNWRKSKEEDLAYKARRWAQQVIESQEEMELEPMPAWERRVIHITVQETDGVESESAGEGPSRHIIIRPSSAQDKSGTSKES